MVFLRVEVVLSEQANPGARESETGVMWYFFPLRSMVRVKEQLVRMAKTKIRHKTTQSTQVSVCCLVARGRFFPRVESENKVEAEVEEEELEEGLEVLLKEDGIEKEGLFES